MMRLHEAQTFTDVLGLADLPPGNQHVHQVGLSRVLICHTAEAQLFAVLDLCPHARQPLAGGALVGSSITCPKHGARFDLESGCPLNGVSKKPLQTLALRVNGERIEVCLP
jgi:3-phenylpropionate/trans-cinnamate dioxygenase ferredoxin subunit